MGGAIIRNSVLPPFKIQNPSIWRRQRGYHNATPLAVVQEVVIGYADLRIGGSEPILP